jgi:hypothetical protein
MFHGTNRFPATLLVERGYNYVHRPSLFLVDLLLAWVNTAIFVSGPARIGPLIVFVWLT